MGWRARWLQAVGVVLFLVTAFLPAHGPCRAPGSVPAAPPGHPAAGWPPPAATGAVDVPAATICTAAGEDLAGTSRGWRLWEARRWYPYVLALFWLAALLMVRGPLGAASARRARAGAFLVGLSVAIAILEACYLGQEYAVLLPEVLGQSEVVLAWLVVVGILVWRRTRDRALGAVEGHVASQALLSLVHMVTLPSSEMRPWIGRHAISDVLSAVLSNFHPAFWVGMGSLAIVVGATLLSGRAPSRPSERSDAGAETASPEFVDLAAEAGQTTSGSSVP